MDRFRNFWRSIDAQSDSARTPMAPNESTTIVSGNNSSGTLSRFMGHQSPQSQLRSLPQPRQNPDPPRSSELDWRGVLRYSPYSTQGPFSPRMFCSENFMLGAGAIIIQPSSGKVVVVQDGDRWFLPKGRKDLGESIEEAALREGYEESGYRCEFLPLYHWTNAPADGSGLAYGRKHSEPLFVNITSYPGRRSRPPGEYLTFWYACQIGPDAVRELGTGMPDEAGFVGRLVTFEEAARLLGGTERSVLIAACNEWLRSTEIDEHIRALAAEQGLQPNPTNPGNHGERI